MSSLRFSYPFRSENGVLPAEVTEEQSIEDSLRILLTTPRGERVMRARYGVNTNLFLFENNDRVLEEAIRFDVVQAVRSFEPRVLLTQVVPSRDLDKGVLQIYLEYVRVSDRTQGTLTLTV